jgi:hypothetical protein
MAGVPHLMCVKQREKLLTLINPISKGKETEDLLIHGDMSLQT